MMYKLTDEEVKRIEKVSEITITDYEVKDNLINVDNLIVMVEDLLVAYHQMEEELGDLEEQMMTCYRPVKPHEVSGWDFR